MENSSEQSRWVSPSLISPDPLANYTTEPGLLPPGEDDEPFYSSSEADLLPSYYSSSVQSRASSSYRHSPGEILTAVVQVKCAISASLNGIAIIIRDQYELFEDMQPLFHWFPHPHKTIVHTKMKYYLLTVMFFQTCMTFSQTQCFNCCLSI